MPEQISFYVCGGCGKPVIAGEVCPRCGKLPPVKVNGEREQAVKTLACIICSYKPIPDCNYRAKTGLPCSNPLIIARRVLAAGYRKVDLEKLTVMNKEQIMASHEGETCGDCGGFIARAQLEHTKREIQRQLEG